MIIISSLVYLAAFVFINCLPFLRSLLSSSITTHSPEFAIICKGPSIWAHNSLCRSLLCQFSYIFSIMILIIKNKPKPTKKEKRKKRKKTQTCLTKPIHCSLFYRASFSQVTSCPIQSTNNFFTSTLPNCLDPHDSCLWLYLKKKNIYYTTLLVRSVC